MTLSRIERIDRFGHCCWCTKNLLTKRVVDGKIIDMFLPEYDHTTFLLDNGSQMQVTLCKKCKAQVELSDANVHKEIMDAVMKGWELETQIKQKEGDPAWTPEHRDKYLEDMGKLNIDCHSEHLSKFVIQEKQVAILKLKVEPVDIIETKEINVSNQV